MDLASYQLGISGDLDAWIDFNRSNAFHSPNGLEVVAPFPPRELIENTSGLTRQDPPTVSKVVRSV